MERHGELIRDREKLERMRVGVATSMMLSAWATKKDGTMWEPADVFPDLRQQSVDRREQNESQRILNKFLIMAGRTKVH